MSANTGRELRPSSPIFFPYCMAAAILIASIHPSLAAESHCCPGGSGAVGSSSRTNPADANAEHQESRIRIDRPLPFMKAKSFLNEQSSSAEHVHSSAEKDPGLSGDTTNGATEKWRSEKTAPSVADQSTISATISMPGSGPYEQFLSWLNASVHPALCPIVLCRGQCTLSDSPCRPLGFQDKLVYASTHSGCCNSEQPSPDSANRDCCQSAGGNSSE